MAGSNSAKNLICGKLEQINKYTKLSPAIDLHDFVWYLQIILCDAEEVQERAHILQKRGKVDRSKAGKDVYLAPQNAQEVCPWAEFLSSRYITST